MVRRRTLVVEPEEQRRLAHDRDHDPRPYLRERCAALLKVAAGQSAHAVARHGLLRPRDPDTVYGWLTLYEEAGILGLIHCRHGGAHRRPL